MKRAPKVAKPKLTPLERTLLRALEDVCVNADEDCPSAYRTEHLREALEVGFELLDKHQKR
jgi:hypothetical protein